MYKKIANFVSSNVSLLAISLVGLLLRLWHLTSISLWHDEAFSALLIKYSWGEMIHRIGLDVHPPLYYIALRIWSYIFGHSLFSLRGMSVFFGIATIIAVYYFVYSAFQNRKAALLAALLVAVNPFQIQYVTEARMYTMGAFFAVAAAWSLTVALRSQVEYYATTTNLVLKAQLQKRFRWAYILFIFCSAVMMYTHYYLLFTVAALGFYGFIFCIVKFRGYIKRYLWLIISGVAILALYLPWLKVFIFQLKQVGAGYWIPPMDQWSIPNTLWELMFRFPNPAKWMLVLISLVVIFILIRVLWKYSQAEKWLVTAGFLAPFAGALLFLGLATLQDNSNSVYLVRYFIFCSAFYSIIVALWLSNLRIPQIGKLLAIALIGINLYSVWNYWDDLELSAKPGMAGAAKFLNANVEPTHKIYLGSSFEFFNYKYYNRTNAKPLLFSNGSLTKDMPHFAGTAILTDEDLVQNFEESTKPGDIVWLMWTNGFGGSKPNVPGNWTQIDEKGFAEVRPYVGTWIIISEYRVN